MVAQPNYGHDQADLIVGDLFEALNRGADEYYIMQRAIPIAAQFNESAHGPYTLRPTWNFGLDYRLELNWQMLAKTAKSIFDAQMAEEFTSLDGFVRRSFDFDHMLGKTETVATIAAVAARYYAPMRTKLYVAGYDEPHLILKKIKPARFLGKDVTGGLHPAFSDKLGEVEGALRALPLGEFENVQGGVGRITGFVPRTQRGSDVPSNHAVGLAIDIDEEFNPDIGGLNRTKAAKAEEISILKRITGYDFGASPLKGNETPDAVEQVWRKEKAASDTLRLWLKTWMGYEDRIAEQKLKDQLSEAPRFHLIDPPPSEQFPLMDTSAGEPDRAHKSKFRLMDKTLEQPQPPDVQLLHRLKTLRTEKELRNWEYHGILRVPLSLVREMIRAGFKWGGTYGRHKDLMHFELELTSVEPRDSGERQLAALPRLSLRSVQFGRRQIAPRKWTLLDQSYSLRFEGKKD